jgi:hypothetical protein
MKPLRSIKKWREEGSCILTKANLLRIYCIKSPSCSAVLPVLKKDKNSVKPETSRVQKEDYRFLNYDNPFKNGISRPSVGSESADISNFEPEFLKNNDSSEEGSDCVELGKSQENVFFKEVFRTNNSISQKSQTVRNLLNPYIIFISFNNHISPIV